VSPVSHHSFRNKVLRTILCSVLIMLGVTGFGLVVIESWISDKKLHQDMQVLADILGNRSRAALEFGDTNAAQLNLSAAKYQKYVDAVCLYDQSSNLFSSYSRNSSAYECSADFSSATIKKSRWQTLTTREVLHLDQSLGRIAIVANRSFIFESLRFFIPLLLVLITLVLLLMTRMLKTVMRSVTMPLEELHETAQALVDDAYSSRRATKRSDDEIGELVDVFNRMLDNLASENLALQSSENRFRTLTSNAPIGIFQLDAEGQLVYANERWHKITGIHTIAGAWDNHASRIVEDDLDLYRSSWERAQQKNQAVLVEYRYRSDSGVEKYLMENVAPLTAGLGMEGMIGTLADVTELKNAQKELEKLAFYDPLSGLPNRRFFIDLLGFGLAKAKRNGTKAAVLMLDIDNFKRVNDLLGHTGGDQLLQQQAQRIRTAVREQDAVSRMGGDEFTIMLAPVNEISEVTSLARRVLDEVNLPITVGAHTIEVGASIGIALYPTDGDKAEDLIRNADMALYEAKGSGRNQVNFFSYKLDQELRESLRLEQKLRHAIRNQALEAFLQPQVSASGEVIWAEALVRWFDPEEGQISPARFIPLAEETGLIHGLGQLMLERVCFHLSQHKGYLREVGIKGIAVNLSGRQFYSRSLLRDIKRVMVETGVEPEQIEFELTESLVMDDVQLAIDVMSRLRDQGFRLSIDDFGTGYSSLSYLKRFPIHCLKIDRSFVEDIPHDPHGSEIATAIIAMAHKLRLTVVAEGVETEAQRDFLIAQGCESLQGYLFGKPKHIQEYVDHGRALFFEKNPGQLKVATNRPTSGE
jgi:diguanylate cyclase (GGDEF)-like protein/PAS domain S-box-containing protein